MFCQFNKFCLKIVKGYVNDFHFVTRSFQLDVGYTDNDTECRNKCDLYGESYNWCWTVSGEFGYCTPVVSGNPFNIASS